MSFFYPGIMALVAALALTSPVPAYAQSDEDEQDQTDGDRDIGVERDGEPESAPPSRPSSPSPAAEPATTATIVAALNSANGYCGLVEPGEYVIDCLAERLDDIRSQLEGQEEFDELRAVLETTSQKLNEIARQNRSATLAPARFSTQGQTPVATTRRLVPVAADRLDTAVSQAIAVIEEAETLLLRSAEQSAERAIQFQRIAAAIGSNKVLLRSL